jgi:hypothetical protein
MPVYQNNTSETITVTGKSGSVTFAPSQAIEVDFFIPEEDGLTLVNELPRVEPQTLATGTLELYRNDNERLYIPKCKAFMATLICKFGQSVVRESYEDAAVTTPLDTLNSFRSAFKRPDVDALWIEGLGNDDDGPTIIAYHIARIS